MGYISQAKYWHGAGPSVSALGQTSFIHSKIDFTRNFMVKSPLWSLYLLGIGFRKHLLQLPFSQLGTDVVRKSTNLKLEYDKDTINFSVENYMKASFLASLRQTKFNGLEWSSLNPEGLGIYSTMFDSPQENPDVYNYFVTSNTYNEFVNFKTGENYLLQKRSRSSTTVDIIQLTYDQLQELGPPTLTHYASKSTIDRYTSIKQNNHRNPQKYKIDKEDLANFFLTIYNSEHENAFGGFFNTVTLDRTNPKNTDWMISDYSLYNPLNLKNYELQLFSCIEELSFRNLKEKFHIEKITQKPILTSSILGRHIFEVATSVSNPIAKIFNSMQKYPSWSIAGGEQLFNSRKDKSESATARNIKLYESHKNIYRNLLADIDEFLVYFQTLSGRYARETKVWKAKILNKNTSRDINGNIEIIDAPGQFFFIDVFPWGRTLESKLQWNKENNFRQLENIKVLQEILKAHDPDPLLDQDIEDARNYFKVDMQKIELEKVEALNNYHKSDNEREKDFILRALKSQEEFFPNSEVDLAAFMDGLGKILVEKTGIDASNFSFSMFHPDKNGHVTSYTHNKKLKFLNHFGAIFENPEDNADVKMETYEFFYRPLNEKEKIIWLDENVNFPNYTYDTFFNPEDTNSNDSNDDDNVTFGKYIHLPAKALSAYGVKAHHSKTVKALLGMAALPANHGASPQKSLDYFFDKYGDDVKEVITRHKLSIQISEKAVLEFHFTVFTPQVPTEMADGSSSSYLKMNYFLIENTGKLDSQNKPIYKKLDGNKFNEFIAKLGADKVIETDQYYPQFISRQLTRAFRFFFKRESRVPEAFVSALDPTKYRRKPNPDEIWINDFLTEENYNEFTNVFYENLLRERYDSKGSQLNYIYNERHFNTLLALRHNGNARLNHHLIDVLKQNLPISKTWLQDNLDSELSGANIQLEVICSLAQKEIEWDAVRINFDNERLIKHICEIVEAAQLLYNNFEDFLAELLEVVI